MKVYSKIVLSLLVAAAASYATVGSAQGLTRAEVRADLIHLEQAGYNPAGGDDANYPAEIQAAEAKVAAQDQQRAAQVDDAVGGMPAGTSDAGTRIAPKKPGPQECVGPASFCNVYLGG
jgi:hypothetical protein